MLVNGDLVGNVSPDLGKVFLSHGAQSAVTDTSGTSENHPGSSVVSLDVVDQVVTGDALDILGGAEDCPAKGSALVSDGVKVIKHNLLEIHLNLLHLSVIKYRE